MNIRRLIIDRDPIFRQKMGAIIASFRDDFHIQTPADAHEAPAALSAADVSLV